MVRLATNTRLVFDPCDVGPGWLILELEGRSVRLRRTDELDFRRILRSAAQAPHRIAMVGLLTLWLFGEDYFWTDDALTGDQVQREIAWLLLRS
jgi:hypothetical protein